MKLNLFILCLAIRSSIGIPKRLAPAEMSQVTFQSAFVEVGHADALESEQTEFAMLLRKVCYRQWESRKRMP